MADSTMDALAALEAQKHMLRGGFYGHSVAPQASTADLPMRPRDQPVTEPPHRNWYIDRLEGDPGSRQAVMVDGAGDTHDVPATSGMKEGFYENGARPGSEGNDIRARLMSDPDPHAVIRLGESLPKVPLAPGSPGPPLPPPADSFIGQKKGPAKKKPPQSP